MQTASRITSDGPRIGHLVVEINYSLNRELNEEEGRFISKCCNEINTMFQTNSYKNHPETIAEIAQERVNLLNCFPSSTLIYVEEIPNEYTIDQINPWFMVTTPKGRIKIGWRKRVINIDWSDSEQKKQSGELFITEDVTKSTYSIHAYGYEKAKEYITKILNQ